MEADKVIAAMECEREGCLGLHKILYTLMFLVFLCLLLVGAGLIATFAVEAGTKVKSNEYVKDKTGIKEVLITSGMLYQAKIGFGVAFLVTFGQLYMLCKLKNSIDTMNHGAIDNCIKYFSLLFLIVWGLAWWGQISFPKQSWNAFLISFAVDLAVFTLFFSKVHYYADLCSVRHYWKGEGAEGLL